jgi:NAD-dependent deacetylase
MDCRKRIKAEAISLDTLPPRCDCGGVIRPDVVFFGEAIPHQALTQSNQEARSCNVMLVIGTSAEVQPAASLPDIAKSHGATIIEINIEATSFTGYTSSYFIKGKAGEILPKIVALVKGNSANPAA